MRALMKVGFSLLLLAFLLIGLSYSMLRAQGTSGTSNPEGRMVASEPRTIGAKVHAVDLNGPIDMTLRQGAVPSLTVRGEQRLLSKVDTTVDEDGTLHIATTGMVLLRHTPLQVTLVLPEVNSIEVHGSGDSTVNGFNGEHVNVALHGSGTVKFNGRFRDVRASVHGSGDLEMNGGSSVKVEAELVGSGDMTVVGSSREFNAEQTGSGELKAQHLTAEKCTLELHGSGSSTLTATKSASVTVRGSGDVVVYGSPNERTISRTGTGEVSFP